MVVVESGCKSDCEQTEGREKPRCVYMPTERLGEELEMGLFVQLRKGPLFKEQMNSLLKEK